MLRCMKRSVYAAGVLAWLFAAVVTTSTTTTLAEPSARDRDTARTLMRRGDRALASGDAERARDAYEQADDIMAVPTTRVALAVALMKAGLLVDARDRLLSVRKIPVQDPEPKPFRVARERAARLAPELSRRIASLHVWLHSDAEPAAPTSTEIADVTPPIANIEASTTPWYVYGGFTMAGAGLVAGGVTGWLAAARTSELREYCDGNRCPANETDQLHADALGLAHVATASFVVAGAGALIGIVGVTVGSSGDSEGDVARVIPVVGPGSVSVTVRF
jgi:hypothetical protein